MDYIALYSQIKPSKLAVKDLSFDREWTYAQWHEQIARCVSVLVSKGVVSGSRVACLSKNRAEMVLLHFACARAGAIFVPLNWRLAAAEIQALLDDCEPLVCFGDELAAKFGFDMLDIDSLIPSCADYDPAPMMEFDWDQPSLMLYTSGTTGLPKGVLLSENNLSENAINFSVFGEVDAESVMLCESPMFHVLGLVGCTRPALFRGARIVISDGFEPQRTLDRISNPDLGITHYFCVPQMALTLRSVEGFDPSKLSHLKGLFTGGAPHPEAQIREWLNDGIAIVDGYGSSEAGSVFGMPLDREVIDQKAGCVGLPTPRIKARLVDASGQVLPDGPGVGELQLLTANIFKGYWRRDEDTEATFSDDGWFCTGDIVSCDEDGFYRVVDRKKDMFISGGENVYPGELEALLVKFPGVKEQAVVGVPDEKWGEVGCIFYASDKEIHLDEFIAFLSPSIARYKLPKMARKVDALPRNGTGKVLKNTLRELLDREQ